MKIPLLSRGMRRQIDQAESAAHSARNLQGRGGQDGSPVYVLPGGNVSSPPIIRPYFNEEIIATTTNAGPKGEADYTDCRYWFKSQYIYQTYDAGANYETNAVALRDETTDFPDSCVYATGTNLAEIMSNTHSLPIGSLVRVKRRIGAMSGLTTAMMLGSDQQAQPYWQYYMEPMAESLTIVLLSSHTGTGPADWTPYSGTDLSGNTYSGNLQSIRERLNGTGNLIIGNPGSLGIEIASDGSVGSSTGGMCKVQPANGPVVLLGKPDPVTGNQLFDFFNSAQ